MGYFMGVRKAIEKRDNSKERVLSEFDSMMLRAMEYNPKENEK
jgi:hypothetical protein